MVTAIIITIALYALLTVYLGFRANQGSLDNVNDYFLASRTLSSSHLAVTTMATWFSTFAFLGAPGFYYSKGFAWGMAIIFYVFVGVLLLWFIGRKLWMVAREKGYITPAELLVDFYNNRTIGYITALISILSLIPYVLIQVVAIGKVIEGSTDGFVSYEVAVVVAGAVAAFYVFLGGMRAIILTDWIQGILFAGVIVISAIVTIYASGGFVPGIENSIAAQPDLFVMDPDNMGFTMSLAFSWMLGFILLPHLWQRTYMAESAQAYTKSIYYQAIITVVLITGISITGLLSIGLVDGLEDSDKLVPTLFSTYIPWAAPLLVLATFAAGMSTTDSQLLTVSSVFVRDIIHPITKERLEKHRGKMISRYLVIALVGFITILALLPESQGPIVLLASKGIGIVVLLLIPLIGPLYWEKATATGAIWGMLSGFSFQLAYEFNAFELPYSFGAPIPSLVIGLIVLFLLSNLSSRKEGAVI